MIIVALWSYNLNGNVRGNHTTYNFNTVEKAKAFLNEQYEVGYNGSWYSSEEEYQEVMFGEVTTNCESCNYDEGHHTMCPNNIINSDYYQQFL